VFTAYSIFNFNEIYHNKNLMEILESEVEDFEDDPEISEDEIDTTKPGRNLAQSMSDAALKKLSTYLLDGIKEDIESRKEWLETADKVKKYLGFGLEDLETVPFKEATRTFETTLSEALIRFVATTCSELLPQSGPAGYKVDGKDFQNDPNLEAEGERRRDNLNKYLTSIDTGYYADFKRFILYLGLYGCIFRKVYPDSISNEPISRFILPEDFIVNGDCTSLLESTRITHVLHLSKREVLLNFKNGIYRDIDLKHLKMSEDTDEDDDLNTKKDRDNGIDLSAYSKRSLIQIYETHTYLDLEEFNETSASNIKSNVPLPYVVAIDKISKEVLYVMENWRSDDEKRKRIDYFVQYNYFPGFGIYGMGLAQFLGTNAISSTTMLRELIDAAKFKNLPAGFRPKGFGQQQNDIIIGPGEWKELDTGGLPLRDALMPLPYAEPCQTLFSLLNLVIEQTRSLGSTSEMGMLDSREDIPAATSILFLEVQNRIQSFVQRSIHDSFDQELGLIDKLLNVDLGVSEDVRIIPVSDPSMNSTAQKILKNRAMLDLAMQAPDLHNMSEVFKLNYEAYGLDQRDIAKILKPDPEKEQEEIMPLDPITENMNASLGMPLKAAIWQEHAAHKLAHGLYAQQYPDLQPAIMAHIKEHDAYEYLVQMQQLLGIELPPLEELQDPQVQNSIALAIAGALQDSGMADQAQQAEPIDPNALLMAEIQAKEAETAAKERIANLRAETDIFKAQLDFEKEKAKIESNEDIAQLRSETELTKQEYSNG
jgi:hypothetical protein